MNLEMVSVGLFTVLEKNPDNSNQACVWFVSDAIFIYRDDHRYMCEIEEVRS